MTISLLIENKHFLQSWKFLSFLFDEFPILFSELTHFIGLSLVRLELDD
jgi:hypothetical protein